MPRPITLPFGRPVAFVSTRAEGVPRFGVVSDGEVPKTRAPVPVAPVTAEARFALDGVPKNVATPVPSPLTPALIGRPVPLVNVTEVGVPKIGVTSVGEVARTLLPVPVFVAAISWPELFEARTAALAGTVAPFTSTVLVAVMVPEPVAAMDAPVPTSIAAWVLVAVVSALNAVAPVELAVTV